MNETWCKSVNHACRFLKMFPVDDGDYRLPEMGIDPDGEINFEWFNSATQCFSISFSVDGTMSFAGRYGYYRFHGKTKLCDKISTTMLNYIKRVG